MYFNIVICILMNILYKMNALLTYEIIPLGGTALTVSSKIRMIDERGPSTAHSFPY